MDEKFAERRARVAAEKRMKSMAAAYARLFGLMDKQAMRVLENPVEFLDDAWQRITDMRVCLLRARDALHPEVKVENPGGPIEFPDPLGETLERNARALKIIERELEKANGR